jgi:hypothetical protein
VCTTTRHRRRGRESRQLLLARFGCSFVPARLSPRGHCLHPTESMSLELAQSVKRRWPFRTFSIHCTYLALCVSVFFFYFNYPRFRFRTYTAAGPPFINHNVRARLLLSPRMHKKKKKHSIELEKRSRDAGLVLKYPLWRKNN